MKLAPQNISTKQLAEEIDKIKKKNLASKKVVPLKEYRELHDLKKHCLLVVDDDPTVRAAIKRIFEKEGYKVIVAEDGTELVKHLDIEPVELILLDIKLPWVDGFELCRLLKQHDYYKDVPIVFLTAKTSEMDKKRGFDVGGHDYLTKPFNIKEVTATVKTLLR